ncbi:MAG: hypothetical protein KJ606_02005 [Chloroflexi bacterium]|nr:hypothetical protein [Chloroflexota bacterium]
MMLINGVILHKLHTLDEVRAVWVLGSAQHGTIRLLVMWILARSILPGFRQTRRIRLAHGAGI